MSDEDHNKTDGKSTGTHQAAGSSPSSSSGPPGERDSASQQKPVSGWKQFLAKLFKTFGGHV